MKKLRSITKDDKLATTDVELTAEDLRGIDTAFAPIDIEGAPLS